MKWVWLITTNKMSYSDDILSDGHHISIITDDITHLSYISPKSPDLQASTIEIPLGISNPLVIFARPMGSAYIRLCLSVRLSLFSYAQNCA